MGANRRETALPAAAHGLLHSGGGHRGRRAGHGDAGQRVNDGNGIAAAGGSGLVELDARELGLHGGRDERRGGGVEREAGRDRLRLLRRRGFWRVAGQRRTFRGARDGNQLWQGRVRQGWGGRAGTERAATHVALGKQTGAKLEVVLELKGADGLEFCAEGRHGGGLVELLHAADAAELPLGVVGYGEAGGPAVAATVVVVVVRHGARLRRVRIVLVV